MASRDTQIKFICVGKSREGIIVAAYEPTRLGNYHKRMTDVMKSSLIKKADSYRVPLKGTDTTIHMLVDNANHVYCVIASNEYPQHVIWGSSGACLLNEFGRRFEESFSDAFEACGDVDGLSRRCLSLLKNLSQKFSAPEKLDSLTRVNAELQEVKAVMVDNIDKVMARGAKLDDLSDKTHDLSMHADRFRKKTKEVSCAMRWKLYRIRLIVAFIVLVIIAIIVILLIK